MKSFTYEKRAADTPQRARYFLNAYAVSSEGGSEPGVGYAWFAELAKRYHVVLFTEAEFSKKTIDVCDSIEQLSCTIHFIDLGTKTRNRCWNQGDWLFYLSYWKYQLKVLQLAFEEIRNHPQPITLHQLNMIGFREPGYFWLIRLIYRIPLIWGPVGGYNFPAPSLYKRYGGKAVLHQRIKNLLNVASMAMPSVLFTYFLATDLYLAIPPQGKMKRILRRGRIFPETFLRLTQTPAGQSDHGARGAGQVNVVLLGKLVPRKLVDVALEALSSLTEHQRDQIRVTVIGGGPSEQFLRHYSEQIGVGRNVLFVGPQPHTQAMEILRKADALLHCAIDEGTSHAIVEAIANAVPVIAFDIGGHSLIAASAGVKLLPFPESRSQAVQTIALALTDLATSRETSAYKRPQKDALPRWAAASRIEVFCSSSSAISEVSQ